MRCLLSEDIQEIFKQINEDLRAIKRYMRRLSPTLEEEARDVIQHRLRNRGIPITISN
ncbi:MAG: hypothetical protein QXQ75_07655 [Candidatus Nitrosocaldaceae archaeon]